MEAKKVYFDTVMATAEKAYNEQLDKIREVARIIIDNWDHNGVTQVFGVKHGQEFSNELFFRAGGLVPYHKLEVDALATAGIFTLEEIKSDEFYNQDHYKEIVGLYNVQKEDMFILTSEKGNEPLIIEFAKHLKEEGHTVVCVVNKAAYDANGGKLLEQADYWLDTYGIYPDSCLDINGVKTGPISATVGNIIAQMLTAEIYALMKKEGKECPILLSANIAGADKFNRELTEVKYKGRVRY